MHNFRAELLNGLSQEQREAFLSECLPRSFHSPKEILLQGLPTDCFFLIEQGQVEVSHLDQSSNDLIVYLAGPGEVLGEVEALSGRPCAATCKALAGSRVLVCSRTVLLKHVPAEQLVVNIAGLLHDRLLRDNRQRSVDIFWAADQRIDHHLYQLTSEAQPTLLVSQSYLANLAGCSRQTVNSRLQKLRQQGVVEISRGKIQVLNRGGLFDGL
jgi:CRP/FNR family cyclic AMP-dependent transcriptional regulator